MKKAVSYSSVSNITYTLKHFWRESKGLMIFALAGIVIRVALPYTGILMPKIVIDLLTNGAAQARRPLHKREGRQPRLRTTARG
jgi:hypothetical protein